MKYLTGSEEQEGLQYIYEVSHVALRATCERSRCGSVIVKDGEIIGRGFNSPPHDDESERRCSIEKGSYDKKVTDKTCCVHAEQRAIMDALRHHPEKISGSRLYFIRLDPSTRLPPSPELWRTSRVKAGKPYCTICSKMALDVGIAEFVLWHEEGVGVYETGEYNEKSFQYKEESLP